MRLIAFCLQPSRGLFRNRERIHADIVYINKEENSFIDNSIRDKSRISSADTPRTAVPRYCQRYLIRENELAGMQTVEKRRCLTNIRRETSDAIKRRINGKFLHFDLPC